MSREKLIADEFLCRLSIMNVGLRFKTLRIKAGFSSAESFAEHAKVSRSFVASFENNQSSPSVRTIERLIKHLPCSLAEFFDEEIEVPESFRRGRKNIELDDVAAYYVKVIVDVLKSDNVIAQAALHSGLKLCEISVAESVPQKRKKPNRAGPNGFSMFEQIISPEFNRAKKEKDRSSATGTRG